MSYFDDIKSGIRTTLGGLKLTFRHLRQATKSRKPMGVAADNYFEQQTGIVTLQYPHEQFPIPDNGRYRLHNEMDDCIVCDKCAKVCPVDCITIDPIKATGEVGKASDGSPIRLYAETFDIDMAKCCFCGLCTVVCPTECLTMEKTFDFSEFELGKLTYHFANLTPEEADEKRTLYEQFVREKEELKAQQVAAKVIVSAPEAVPAARPKPVFRPTAKPAAPAAAPDNLAGPQPSVPADETKAIQTEPPADEIPVSKPKPAFRPTLKPAAPKPPTDELKTTEPVTEDSTESAIPAPKKPFRPTQRPQAVQPDNGQNSAGGNILHPLTDPAPDEAEAIAMTGIANDAKMTEPMTEAEKAEPPVPAKKPAAFRPTMKPAVKTIPAEPAIDSEPTPAPTKKPAFRPTMKPAAPAKPTDTDASRETD